MLESIEQLDKTLFLIINGWHTPFFDHVMWIISGKLTWIPLYIFLLYRLFKTTGKLWWLALIATVLLITLADQVSVAAFKNVFMRYRPCHNLDLMGKVHLVKNHCGGQYGFVSSHASNFFAMAVFFALVFQKKWITILLLSVATMVAYSRIYLGVHYPADVMAGGLVGASIGFVVFKVYQWSKFKFEKLG